MARKRKRRYTRAFRALQSVPATDGTRHDPGPAAALSWGGMFVSSFLVALFVAWHLLARADFFYAAWYEVLDIGQTVSTYGPQNRYRQGFASTDKREHQRLFAGIVTAIHDDGAGLETLQYFDADNGIDRSFLTEAEIVHLRDVATLINKVNIAGAAAIAVMMILLALIVTRRLSPPSLVRFHVGAAAVLTAAVALALSFGAEDTFYAMHEWVFPPDHQWFFFYRDSLMSTFMQAPNLFGYIALALAVLALALYVAWIAGLIYFVRRAADRV